MSANMNELFFELFRIAIGAQDSISHTPLVKEWETLYDMAIMHSLVGVCFAGLQKLGTDADSGKALICISEMQYLTSYISAPTLNEAMHSGAWTSMAQ